jgi:uncharacterized membrane-anchored protein
MKDLYFNICEDILNTLAKDSNRYYSLEELTKTVTSNFNNESFNFEQRINDERHNQAKVLDALIVLDNKGLVVLNSLTDESRISHKGLL